VHGTDGSQYHTGVQKGSSLATWVDALYRSATIVNENDLEVTYKDMKLLRFVIPKWRMYPSTLTMRNTI
jgi:hypothetical protein